MSNDDDQGSPRKGKVSAFTLLTSWLFNKRGHEPVKEETEFLNTRDGYELARFAKHAFGGDAEAQRRREAAIEAEQAEIDQLLQGTGAVPIPHQASAAADAPHAAAPPAAAPEAPPAPPAVPKPTAADKPLTPLEKAVQHLEALRAQGMTVEILAEALIVIESREVKRRNAAAR